MTPWVRLVEVPGFWSRVTFPPWLGNGPVPRPVPRLVTVRAGLAAAPAWLAPTRGTDVDGGGADHPAELQLTGELREALALPLGPRYRLRWTGDGPEIGPVIGLLLGNQPHRYDRRYMAKFLDRLGVYPRCGGLIGAFSAGCVDWDRRVAHGLYYDPGAGGWRHGAFPLPAVIYRRNFRTVAGDVRRLADATGGRLFNSHRPTKWDVHVQLEADPDLAPHLPETRRVRDGADVEALLERHGVVILKPSALSRGRGICIVKAVDGRYRLVDYRRPEIRRRLFPASTLRRLAAEDFAPRDYLVQQYVDLARIGRSVFDLRVVMQRSPGGAWMRTGMECRLGPPGEHITNLARGGRAMAFHEALALALGGQADTRAILDRVMAVAHGFCRCMDRQPEHFAEWGLDLGIDMAGRVWFLEANVFPSFKGIRKLDPDAYRRIRYAPLEYAAALAGFEPLDVGKVEPA